MLDLDLVIPELPVTATRKTPVPDGRFVLADRRPVDEAERRVEAVADVFEQDAAV